MTDWTLEDIWYKIEDEGLGYCVEDYFSLDTIRDCGGDELLELWQKAQTALQDIRTYFEEQGLTDNILYDDDDADNETDEDY